MLILGLDNAGKTTILYKLHSPDQVTARLYARLFYRLLPVALAPPSHSLFLLLLLLFRYHSLIVASRLTCQVVRTMPTIGFNVESITVKNLTFQGTYMACTAPLLSVHLSHRPILSPVAPVVSWVSSVWDLGGQTNIRPYWRCYYANTNAIIYVVDSADKERLGLSKKELLSMLEEEELKDAVLLVMANKQDMKEALSDEEVAVGLGLTGIKDRTWHIVKTSAIKGVGLEDGMEWLTNAIIGTK